MTNTFDPARISALIHDAVSRLDAADFAERVAYCRKHNRHGVRLLPADDAGDDVLELWWGGRKLAALGPGVLDADPGPVAVTHVSDVPDTPAALFDDPDADPANH